MEKKNESQIKYYVNEEKRIVIAILKDTRKNAFEFIKGNTKTILPLMITEETQEIPTKLLLKDLYVGKAKCREDDDFDVEKGKEIAKVKVLRKLYKDFYISINEWEKETEIKLKSMNIKALNKYMNTIANERSVLEENI